MENNFLANVVKVAISSMQSLIQDKITMIKFSSMRTGDKKFNGKIFLLAKSFAYNYGTSTTMWGLRVIFGEYVRFTEFISAS